MSTPSLARPAAILTIPLIYPQYNSLIRLSNIAMHFHISHPLYHHWISSTFQPITHIHPFHELISDGTRRIGNFSTSFTSIPQQALLDHHCTCITWKFGMPLETFQQATHQNTIPQILGPTSISTNTTTHFTPARIIQHTGHIQIQQDYSHLCHQSTELQPTADQHMMQKKLIPFLGTALSWLTGTANTKDICNIKTRINQLIATQTLQCNTLVHIVSILNVTRYATQVNRHSINNLIDAMHTTSQDINNLYNLTTSLAASINFNQMVLHIRSVFANLQDSLHYLHSFHTHHGLHWHCHFWHTVTTCFTSCRSTEDAPTHCCHLTPNLAPTNITWGHPTLLQILMYTCLNRE